jgi:protein TonB
VFRSFEAKREDRAAGVSGKLLSAGLHVVTIAVVLFAASRVPHLRTVKLPGSASGTHLLLEYSTGGVASESQSAVAKPVAATVKPEIAMKYPPLPSAAMTRPQAEQGSGPAGMNGLGDGDVTIALPTVSPRPEPDLSSLAHGASGNVILNAVIDANGAITELTVLQSLNANVDQQVMATVRGWSFKPAMKNGQPVVSEQEIVLHYERG